MVESHKLNHTMQHYPQTESSMTKTKGTNMGPMNMVPKKEIAVGKIPPLASLSRHQKRMFDHPGFIFETNTGTSTPFERMSLQPQSKKSKKNNLMDGKAAMLYAN